MQSSQEHSKPNELSDSTFSIEFEGDKVNCSTIQDNYRYIKPATLKTKRVYDYYIWFINEKEESDLFIGMNNEYSYEEAELECVNFLITTLK